MILPEWPHQIPEMDPIMRMKSIEAALPRSSDSDVDPVVDPVCNAPVPTALRILMTVNVARVQNLKMFSFGP